MYSFANTPLILCILSFLITGCSLNCSQGANFSSNNLTQIIITPIQLPVVSNIILLFRTQLKVRSDENEMRTGSLNTR